MAVRVDASATWAPPISEYYVDFLCIPKLVSTKLCAASEKVKALEFTIERRLRSVGVGLVVMCCGRSRLVLWCGLGLILEVVGATGILFERIILSICLYA